MIGRAASLAVLLWPAVAGAWAPRFAVEAAALGVEHLGGAYATSGLESRTAARLGGGLEARLAPGVALGLGIGIAAGTSDFGLMGGPRSRLVRTDAALELRGRPPLAWRGFAAQVAAGFGRLRLAYRPDRIVLDVGGGPIPVALESVGVWTWQAAAEVLHPVPGGELGLRCGWRSYALRVATPAGTESRPVGDLQLGLVLRVLLVP